MAFPTLSRSRVSVNITSEENVISSPLEAGYEHRRPRHSRERKSLAVIYDLLPTVDKELLVAHQASVGLSTAFVFTDGDGVNYTVYYTARFEYVQSFKGYWKFNTIDMREI